MLTLWKRHSATCEKTLLQKIDIEKRRFYRKCRCACWVTGVHPITHKGIKQSLKTTSWEVAEKLVRQLETNTPADLERKQITIKDAFKAWFEFKRQLKKVAEATIENMYTALEVKVLKFAEDKGLVLLTQFDDDTTYDLVMSPLWNEWGDSTADRQFSNLDSFFKFAVSRKWTATNPVNNIDRTKSRHIPVDPYTPEEEDRLEGAFASWTGSRFHGCMGLWAEHTATLRCLKHVLDDTGLRISDAQRVRPAIIRVLPSGHGTCTLLQTKSDSDCAKSDGEVTVYLKPQTLAEMAQVPWISARYPFMSGCEDQRKGETDKEYRRRFKSHLAEESKKVYYAMRAVGKLAGVADCRPHRFRHTFAVKLLTNGWEIGEVSRLLGHRNINTTQKYYAKWNTQRQEQLGDKVISRREAECAVAQMPQGDARKAG